ncbi:MAG: DUF2589 domain-containing protein [Bacteroidota bacterium]
MNESLLKSALERDHSDKTVAQLHHLLKAITPILPTEVFREALDKSEIKNLKRAKKNELVALLQMLNESYESSWEELVEFANENIIRTLKETNGDLRIQNAEDADFTAELGNIDFEDLIGGPLVAAVEAQGMAALGTIKFIQEVGFEPRSEEDDTNKVRTVDFSYVRTVNNEDGTTRQEKVNINVPLLTMVNVPSFRIENVDIDFNVKLNSVFKENITNTLGIGGGVKGIFKVIQFKVTPSFQRTSNRGTEVKKEYTMGVKVRATSDEIPAGLERILGLLGDYQEEDAS